MTCSSDSRPILETVETRKAAEKSSVPEIPDAARAVLKKLVALWRHRFQGKLDDSVIEESKLLSSILSAEGICYFRCAQELEKLLESGDTPPDFELQVLFQNRK